MKRYIQWMCGAMLLAGWTACGNADRFTIKGEMKNMDGDTLFVLLDEPKTDMDTLYVVDGKFSYEIPADTPVAMRILNTKGETLFLFGKNGETVELKGDFGQPQMKTKGENEAYAAFLNELSGRKTQEQQEQAAEAFIRSHPTTKTSAYILDKYFLETSAPVAAKIRELYALLDGEVKDSRILKGIEDKLKRLQEGGQTLAYFPLKDRNGTTQNWDSEDKKFLLIAFWASWDKNSVAEHDSLYTAIKNIPEKHLKVISVSLDVDPATWRKACKPDSKKWLEVCDFQSWENVAVRQQNIGSLPYNFLLDRYRSILGTNIHRKDLKAQIDTLLAR